MKGEVGIEGEIIWVSKGGTIKISALKCAGGWTLRPRRETESGRKLRRLGREGKGRPEKRGSRRKNGKNGVEA